MEKTSASYLSLVLICILVLTLATNVIPVMTAKGPRTANLTVTFGATMWDLATAGTIDLLAGTGWSPALELLDGNGLLDATDFGTAMNNPNIVLAPVAAANTHQLDLNNNYSISTYPGVRSPMNYTEMRQAIAFLTDKDDIVNTDCGGLAQRIDQMIAAPFYGWANESMSYPYYPYEYDPWAARVLLDSTFPEGTDPNPAYDPAVLWSAQFLRTYPADHPQKPGLTLDPLIICERSDDTRWASAMPKIEGDLSCIGIPWNSTGTTGGRAALYDRVMGDRDYHIYTGGWTMDRFPPVALYQLYHSTSAYPYGKNYVTGAWFDDPAGPGAYQTHPQLDEYLYNTNYAAGYSDAVTACKLAAGYMTDICVNIPIWSDVSYCAYSTRLQGVVNMPGWGPLNPFTLMNFYDSGGGAIRIGITNTPTKLNTVYSDWIIEFLCLDLMTLYGGIGFPPYNVAADQAGFVDYWDTTTWDDSGTTKTKVVMSFREDGYFAKPVTGDQGEHINASHYFWNAWLDYQVGDGWFSPLFKDLHHVTITGPYDFEIYFDTLSWFNTYYCQGPLRPMDLWMAQGPAFINQTTETVSAPPMPGAISLTYDPVWFTAVTAGGIPLTFMTDYNIIRGDLTILTPHAGDLVVTYWYVPDNALRGFTPGNLPWGTILEGAGPYYITAYTAGVSATFSRNPFYYMVTPLLGDIDFVKKPSGNYKIDIFDLVFVAGAYGSQGTGIPSGHWFPGADLAPAGGKVDIFDIVTAASRYGQEFDPIEP